jgi:hypothetical protein
MVKMKKDGKKYEIAEHRVEKLLKRGFTMVIDTPEPKDVLTEQTEMSTNTKFNKGDA